MIHRSVRPAERYQLRIEPGHSDEAVLLLGGEPRWVQYDERPLSSVTAQPMVFIGQLNADKITDLPDDTLSLFYCPTGNVFVEMTQCT